MGRSNRISEGISASYGRHEPSELERMMMWRNAMSNERKGMPERDNFGSNAGVSLLWLPYGANENAYRSGSQRRVSALKQTQDFGLARPPVPPPASLKPPPAAAASLKPPPAAAGSELTSSGMGFLDVEASRLQAAAQARQIGQTFLMQGNLTQAKLFLKRAERMLDAGLERPPTEGGAR